MSHRTTLTALTTGITRWPIAGVLLSGVARSALFNHTRLLAIGGLVSLSLVSNMSCGGGSSATSPTPVTPPSQHQVAVTAGCYNSSYQNVNQGNFACGLLDSFGDSSLDAAFASETSIQNGFWGFAVPVLPFDECPGNRNALSSSMGFILFGRNLVHDVISRTGSGIGVSAALAHEYAHQVQFSNGWMRPWESTQKTTELEADAFAGYYVALHWQIDSPTLDAYFQALSSFGDYAFNSPDHHGTPNSRREAGALGMLTAWDVRDRKLTPTYQELHDTFVYQILNAQLATSAQKPSPTSLLRSAEMKRKAAAI
jgi:hypothetical protein